MKGGSDENAKRRIVRLNLIPKQHKGPPKRAYRWCNPRLTGLAVVIPVTLTVVTHVAFAVMIHVALTVMLLALNFPALHILGVLQSSTLLRRNLAIGLGLVFHPLNMLLPTLKAGSFLGGELT